MLENITQEIRQNPEKFINAVANLTNLHGHVILDCGHKGNGEISLVELNNGLFVVVCKDCESLATSEEAGGILNSKFIC